MRAAYILLSALMLPQIACAQESLQNVQEKMIKPILDEEIFKAAGFEKSDGSWRKCDDPGTLSYEPGAITQRGDFNGDGMFDALVTEGGSFCFGMIGFAYTLVSRSNDGTWRILDERIGMPRFLEAKGAEGWPDIEVGGPGFCFPVVRWNGSEYMVDRYEYEGRRCQG